VRRLRDVARCRDRSHQAGGDRRRREDVMIEAVVDANMWEPEWPVYA
jgi:hypothetical protein